MLIYNENHTHWCTRADEAAGKWQSGGWMTRGRAEIADSKENGKEGETVYVTKRKWNLYVCMETVSCTCPANTGNDFCEVYNTSLPLIGCQASTY